MRFYRHRFLPACVPDRGVTGRYLLVNDREPPERRRHLAFTFEDPSEVSVGSMCASAWDTQHWSHLNEWIKSAEEISREEFVRVWEMAVDFMEKQTHAVLAAY